MNDKISFIVPIYKVDLKYLDICLNSIVNQQYNNIELLIILDGADEMVYNFCKEFSNNDARINIISRENRGVSYTRNEGIEKATGKWITFVDADDWVEKDMCQIFVDRLSKLSVTPDFVLMKNFISGKLDREIINCISDDCYIDDDFKLKLFQSTYGTKYGDFPCCEAVWKNFFNRKFLLDHNIKFDISLKIGEDMLFNYQVWSGSKNAYYINIPVYHYRINEQSVMNSSFEKILSNYSVLFPIFFKNIEMLPEKYRQNSESFVIKQVERFALNNFFVEKNRYKEFRTFVSDDFYQNKIKITKLKSLSGKHKIFTLLLKMKMYYFLGIVCLLVNKRKG